MGFTRVLAFASIAAVAAVACATSPLGRSQLMMVGDSEMDQMGAQAFDQMKQETRVSNDPGTNAYVNCVANAITSVLDPAKIPGGAGPWEVRVFEDETANAFALPGRKIGVHTGLLKVAKNQDQLATVIGHEVGHVMARHSAERVSDQFATQIAAQGAGVLLGVLGTPGSATNGLAMAALGVGAQGVVLKFSRTHESEADLLGLDYMSEAGFDPRESVNLWQNMEAASEGARPPEFLSTHPSPATRIRDLEARIPQELPVEEHAHKQGRNPRCR